MLVLAGLATLAACSKSNEAADPPAGQEAAAQSAAAAAKLTAFRRTTTADFAAQFVSSAAEACASVTCKQRPDLTSVSPMQYTARGVIDWGKGRLDDVKEPGASVVLTSSRAEKTVAFGVDIHARPQGNRKGVDGLSQLNGGSLSATVADETQAADGSADRTRGNLCVGGAAPTRVAQGIWPLAAQDLPVPSTAMSCSAICKFESQTLSFGFDGKTIQAGTASFSAADSGEGESLTIDPNGGTANVIYSITKADHTGVSLGWFGAQVLSAATIELPGGVPLMGAHK